MLALVAGCSAAPHPIVPAQEGGKVCLSTSVELKTVTCNIDCNVDHYANNPDTQICPEACVCASTVQANDLTGALPSDEFARLVAVASDRSAGANQVVRSQVTSSSYAMAPRVLMILPTPDDHQMKITHLCTNRIHYFSSFCI